MFASCKIQSKFQLGTPERNTAVALDQTHRLICNFLFTEENRRSSAAGLVPEYHNSGSCNKNKIIFFCCSEKLLKGMAIKQKKIRKYKRWLGSKGLSGHHSHIFEQHAQLQGFRETSSAKPPVAPCKVLKVIPYKSTSFTAALSA